MWIFFNNITIVSYLVGDQDTIGHQLVDFTLTVPQLQQSTHGFWIFLRLTWGRLFPMFLWCGMAVLHQKIFIILILWDMPTYCIGYPWSPFCPWCYQNSYPQSKKLWCLLVCSTYIDSNTICPDCRIFITLFQYYYCYSLVSYPFPSSAHCVIFKRGN